jgi:hypothetical protein
MSSESENKVKKVIDKLKSVQNIDDILSWMVKYMGHDRLRQCINKLDKDISLPVSQYNKELLEMVDTLKDTNCAVLAYKKLKTDFYFLISRYDEKTKAWKFGANTWMSKTTVVKKCTAKHNRSETKLSEEKAIALLSDLKGKDSPKPNQIAQYISGAQWENDGKGINLFRRDISSGKRSSVKSSGSALSKRSAKSSGSALSKKSAKSSGSALSKKSAKSSGSKKPVKKEYDLSKVKKAFVGTTCKLLAYNPGAKTAKYAVGKYNETTKKWTIRKVAGGGVWLTKTTAISEKACTKLKGNSVKLIKKDFQTLLDTHGVEDDFRLVGRVTAKGSAFGKGLMFGKIQQFAANKNMYIVGARPHLKTFKFLTYKFDSKKKDWNRKKNKQPKGTWMTMKSIKTAKNKFGSKPSKQILHNFMSMKKLYLDNQFNFGKDIQLKPIKYSKFGVMKGQLYPLGKGAFTEGPHKGVSSTFSQAYVENKGLWKKMPPPTEKQRNFNVSQFGKKKVSCFGSTPNNWSKNAVLNAYTGKMQNGVSKYMYGYKGTQSKYGGFAGMTGYPSLSNQIIKQKLVPLK